MTPFANERGVIVDWLGRAILLLSVCGVMLFDGASAVVNYLGLESAADDIVAAVSADLTSNRVPTTLEVQREAAVLASEAGARLVKAEVDYQGVVRIKLRRTATTLVLGHIDAAKKWTRATATASYDTRSN